LAIFINQIGKQLTIFKNPYEKEIYIHKFGNALAEADVLLKSAEITSSLPAMPCDAFNILQQNASFGKIF